LSNAVTAWIDDRFDGDRAAAERAASGILRRALGTGGVDRWPNAEQRAYRQLALLVAQIPDLGHWPSADKRALIALMRAKGSDEFRFHDLLSRHRRLSAALSSLAAPADS
jgi:hypothetical protein